MPQDVKLKNDREEDWHGNVFMRYLFEAGKEIHMTNKQKFQLRIQDTLKEAMKLDLTSIPEEIEAVKAKMALDKRKMAILEGLPYDRREIISKTKTEALSPTNEGSVNSPAIKSEDLDFSHVNKNKFELKCQKLD